MTTKAKRPWYRRWWVMLGIVLVTLGSLALGAKLYYEYLADRELSAEVALLNESDPNWQLEDWEKRRPALRDEQNLAVTVMQLKSQAEPEPDSYTHLFSEAASYPAHLLNQQQREVLRGMLKNCQTLPVEMEQILQQQTGMFPLPEWKKKDFRAFSTASPEGQQRLQFITQTLIQQSELWLQDQQTALAIQAVETILRLGHCCEYDLGLISPMTAMSIQSRVASLVERILAMSQPDQAALEKLQTTLLREVDNPYFHQGLVFERAVIDRFLREVGDGRFSIGEIKRMFSVRFRNNETYSLYDFYSKVKEWAGSSPEGYIPAERTMALKFFRQLFDRMKVQPAPDLNEMRDLVRGYQGNSFSVDNACRSLRAFYEDDLKRKVKLQMAAALVASERYRLATGKIPAGWSDIVPSFLPAVPVDPYDRNPLRWKNTPTGFVIYSIWMNGVDDGGAIRQLAFGQQVDVGVEFFAPALRRQPALPVKYVNGFNLPPDDRDLFFTAARSGDVAKIKQLLETGFDVNTKTEYGATGLCYAAEGGHLEVMKLLIEKKIDINAKDTFYTADAITWAQMADKDESVALLLKAGAKGETSILASAIFNNKPKMVAAALASGRIKQATLDSSLTNIDPKKTEIIKLLVDAGGKAKPKDHKPEEKKADTASKTTPKTDDTPQPTAPVVEFTEKPKVAEPWPGFRGHGNSGVVNGQYPPTSWDATTGKNLAWKTPIPGLGLSCPVVWGNQLYVTTAINEASPKPSLRIGQYGDVDSVKETTPHTWKTYCLETSTGKVLWEKVAYVGVPKVKRHMKSSHANATPATDGKVVVVNFGSEGLYCYTKEGDLLWRKDLGKLGSSWFFNPDYEWGFGSSPVIYRDTVIVQCDIGKNSFIAAYSLLDGEEYWMTPRDEIPSWTSPTIVLSEKGPPELVTSASKFARSYNPSSGTELWKIGKFSEIAVPTPFYANGLIYLTTGYRPIQPMYAIKPGGRGDLSLPKDKESSDYVAWSKQRGGPYLPTPLVYGDHLYVCTNAGVLSCYEAKTGKTIYQKRLGGKSGYTASLVAADGRLYCTDEEGLVRVVKTGPEFQILALNKLGEECLSHPAISFGRIFFRGREHVMAFEAGK